MVKKQLSDEQIDALMRTLVNEAAADEVLVGEIADSPATWWGVQRKINEQKATTISAWPPVGKMLRWILAGASVTAAAVLILAFFVFGPGSNDQQRTVAVVSPESSVVQSSPETVTGSVLPPATNNKAVNNVFSDTGHDATIRPAKVIHQAAVKPRKVEQKNLLKTEIAQTTAKEEIKTEFIALSYARDPESGQIVRVKVPSSMMVSLGLVSHVKTPSEMVDAEVLVGDDGLTRAIRFIR